jgi:glutamate racemase
VATTILVFDSGLGGLTVFREVAKARPGARYLYVADDAFFPYGGRGEAELVARVGALMGELIETHRPDLIVIACNAASTLVLPHLRTRFRVPFVGTVPAIKPACAVSRTKLNGAPVADDLIAREIAPCFVDAGGRRTDTIVLACTHYPLLLDRFERLSPWPVTFVDPAPAIARRVADLLGDAASTEPPSPPRFVFTSGREPSAALGAALARFGIGR